MRKTWSLSPPAEPIPSAKSLSSARDGSVERLGGVMVDPQCRHRKRAKPLGQRSAGPRPSFSPAEIACRGTGKLLVNEPALDKTRLHTAGFCC
jgi:hypothetical protein